MKFDCIYMNPPYKVGSIVTKEAISNADRTVCLMPLSQYKSGLYKHVESFELADPKVFSDADITNNLCICVLCSSEVNRHNWDDIEAYSRDPKFAAFYEHNKTHKASCIRDNLINATIRDYWTVYNTFLEGHRTAKDGVYPSNGWGRRFNVDESLTFDDVPHISTNAVRAMALNFTTDTCKKNFTKWWYSKGKDGLANAVVVGLHSMGKVEPAIPQIDWNTISDHPLWVQGDYDGAVLDVMGLKWNNDKSGVVEKQDITKKVYNIN